MTRVYQVKLTPRADADLQEIREYLEKEAPHYVGQVVRELDAALWSLRRLPLLHRIYLRRARAEKSVRFYPVHPYVIYYRVDEAAGDVWIQSVRHTSRRPPRRFP